MRKCQAHHLENTGCITGNSDVKVNIFGNNNYIYPDASVTCDDRDKTTTQYITYPCLIVEVLSKTTEAYDRGGKFRMYQNNPVLKDYLLVSSTAIELKSINLNFPIEQVYRGLTLEPGNGE